MTSKAILKRRAFIVSAILCMISTLAFAQSAPRPQAEWTIMVYLNGDNNLEDYAIIDFLEMAGVGSTDQVNVIVQFDRWKGEVFRNIKPGWTETLRFRVTRKMIPLVTTAIPRPGPQELDMGDGQVLRDFVEWARGQFPAKKYALVIWDHGDGFRRIVPENGAPAVKVPTVRSTDQVAYKAVSQDETNRSVLFNRDIADSLKVALHGDKLDVLVFDACLMGMVEVGYAMRDVADVLVASEDLEPANGWDYKDWLTALTADPKSYDAEKLGALLVRSYRKTYSQAAPPNGDPATTQAATRLTKVADLAADLGELSNRLIENLGTESLVVREARKACAVYAPCQKCNGQQPCYLNVDLGRFLDELVRRSGNTAVINAANKARQTLAASVIESYTGSSRAGDWGSSGLAIYFPADGDSYNRDVSRKDAYEKGNLIFPVEFVEQNNWPTFLHRYFESLRGLHLSGASAEQALSLNCSGRGDRQ